MPEPISIGTYTNPSSLMERLHRELRLLQQEGIPVEVDIDQIGEFTFLDCFPRSKGVLSEDDSWESIKNSVANCLAQVIVEEWETLIIKKIVRDNYYYYNEEEKQVIFQKTKEILNPRGLNVYRQRERKEKVMERLLEYLDLNRDLILEGFVNFRLKDYQKELENVVSAAVDEFLLEKEYAEFIRLLTYFVEIQEPRVQKVQIVFKKKGNFALLNEHDQPLHHESLEGLMNDMLANDINFEDLLISALITLAPQELLLHVEAGVKDSDAIKTIRLVFKERVTNCPGCSKCGGNKE